LGGEGGGGGVGGFAVGSPLNVERVDVGHFTHTHIVNNHHNKQNGLFFFSYSVCCGDYSLCGGGWKCPEEERST
jgi:hypothetical protein